MKNYKKYIDKHTIDCDCSRRGEGLKIDASELFPYIDNAVMGAYQNYLGGGMLGAVVGASMFTPDELKKTDQKIFYDLKEEIKEYFHNLTNEEAEDYDKWGASDYIKNQNRPVSAY